METVIRVVITYLFLVAGIRLLGKREFSQLSPLEFVSLLLIPEMVTQGLNRQDYSLTHALLAVSTLFSLVFLTSVITHLSRRTEKLISGTPQVLVYHGKLVKDTMHKERVSAEEIFSEMHKSGLERLEQVRWAILENGGAISVVPEPSQKD